MDAVAQQVLNGMNRAVIRYRTTYAQWTAQHHTNYHEMLIFYTIREQGYFTQKQVCEDFRLPRQTIHNVVAGMRRAGLLQHSPSLSIGREKAFTLTEQGKAYCAPLLGDLLAVEEAAIRQIGLEKMQAITDLLNEYDRAFHAAMDRAEETT